MDLSKPELISTKDGSHTLYIKGLDEHYHSIFGAVTESHHVYIKAGLKELAEDQINILEMGFGTGLNAILTLIETRGSTKSIHYTGLEKYPIEDSIYEAINYSSLPNVDDKENSFMLLHRCPWNKPVVISKDFILEKIEDDIQNLDISDRFNLVYYDAFGPDKQPELWTPDIFSRIYRSMKKGGILTTYSTKGRMRRSMMAAGFRVERLPGPPGKHDMTRAWKD